MPLTAMHQVCPSCGGMVGTAAVGCGVGFTVTDPPLTGSVTVPAAVVFTVVAVVEPVKVWDGPMSVSGVVEEAGA